MFSSAIRMIPRRLQFCVPTRTILPSRLQKVQCREKLGCVSVSNNTRQLKGLIFGDKGKTSEIKTSKLSASGQLYVQKFERSITRLVQEAGLFELVGETKIFRNVGSEYDAVAVDGMKALKQAAEGSSLAAYQRDFRIIEKKPRRKSSSRFKLCSPRGMSMTVRKIRVEVRNLVNQLRDIPENRLKPTAFARMEIF